MPGRLALAAVAALALLLCGCASSPRSPEPAPPAAQPGSPAVLHFAGNYSVEDDEVGTPVTYKAAGFEQPGNCILLQGHPTILRGTATATWSPGPASSAMELLLENSSTYVSSQVGTGFIELHLDSGELATDSAVLWQLARTNLEGTAVRAQALVRLDFDYTLPADSDGLDVVPGYSCWLDH